MSRYRVYEEKTSDNLLLDVQADLLDGLNTRIVVPLLPMENAPLCAGQLNPVFEIREERFVMVTQFLSAVSVSEIGEEVVDLIEKDIEIQKALDMLFSGF